MCLRRGTVLTSRIILTAPVGCSGADGRTRTHDLLITSQPLYQLSYTSIWQPESHRRHGEVPRCPFYARGISKIERSRTGNQKKPFGGAAGRNRTAVLWLEARCSAVELQPHVGGEVRPPHLVRRKRERNLERAEGWSALLCHLWHDTILAQF